MSNIITIKNVRAYLDESGTAQINLEDAARGLGFVQTKNGAEYVRWETVNGYLSDLGFSQHVGKAMDTLFIPENIFYRLAMKAKNETAEKFQALVADEILPSIRKTGSYISVPRSLPEALRLAADLAEKNETLLLENAQSKQIICELQPKAGYYDAILHNKDIVPISLIAKDYGMSAESMNKLLHELGVQYKLHKTWLLYQEHADKGYTQSKTHVIDAERSRMHTQWTQKGRLFIYDLLKNKKGILPLIEREKAG